MYGENSGHLRDALGVLLREHRIQQRLGGKGIHSVRESTTQTEREELGRQIRRYRENVLTWCLQAVRASNPSNDLDGATGRSQGRAEGLRHHLTEALSASTAGLARSEELVTEQRFVTLETWRDAARAAAIGEHDFTAGVSYGRLSTQECMTVLKDAADIVRGLVALDRRYQRVPGWEKLHNQGWLLRAAETCAAHAGHDDPDYTVDRRGWQPTPQALDGPAMPGLAGVLQAQYNLLIQLDAFPTARSLRIVLDSQRVVAREAGAWVGNADPDLAAKWATRAKTYNKLVGESRDLGGLLGKAHVVGHASVAASRARQLRRERIADAKLLRQLDRLFTRIDERVCDAVEYGVRKRLYFLRVAFPRIDDHLPGPVKGQRHRFVPITSRVQTGLMDIVDIELRPDPIRLRPPEGAGRSRADFDAAITHRPADSGPSLPM